MSQAVAGYGRSGAGGEGGGNTTVLLPPASGEELARFIEDLREVMGWLVGEADLVIEGEILSPRSETHDLLTPDLVPVYRQALQDLDRDFALVLAQLRQPGIEPYIRAVGMWDAHLRFKLDGIKTAINAIRDQPVKAVRVFFKLANNVLGSLASVIPGVESIKEYKEGLEGGMDLADLAAGNRGQRPRRQTGEEVIL